MSAAADVIVLYTAYALLSACCAQLLSELCTNLASLLTAFIAYTVHLALCCESAEMASTQRYRLQFGQRCAAQKEVLAADDDC